MTSGIAVFLAGLIIICFLAVIISGMAYALLLFSSKFEDAEFDVFDDEDEEAIL